MTIYDQFASQFRAPSLMLRSNYFDFRSKPSPFFEADREFFVVHPQRRSFIRQAACGEFDYTPDGGPFGEELPKALHLDTLGMPDALIRKVWRLIPSLHVLVSRIDPECHNITVLLRGPHWWKRHDQEGRSVDSLQSDAELAPILRKIAAMEGFDIAAWQRFATAFDHAQHLPMQSSIATRVH